MACPPFLACLHAARVSAQEICKQILVKSLTFFFFAFLINFHVFFTAAVLLAREDAKAARTPSLNMYGSTEHHQMV